MKELKIGNIIITKKAILLIALQLFITGISIGVSVAYKQENGTSINLILLFGFIFIPFILFRKSIQREIKEMK